MTDCQTELDRSVISLDVAVDEPPQKLWRALTEPRLVERWLAPVVERSLDPARAREGDGLTCQLIATDDGRSASYIWRDPEAGASLVTFLVSERADGFSRLSVVHTGLPRATAAMSGVEGCRLMFGGQFAKRCRPAASNTAGIVPPLLMAA